jgi:hypothetical protein
MDTDRILAELRAERQRLDRAITALELLGHAGPSIRPRRPARLTRRRRHMSAAARKRMSEMMKKRWAERRKKTKSARPTAG